jgi:histidinol dehydrogenase
MRILDFSSDPGGVHALIERRWDEDRDLDQRVREIVDAVQRDGDAALIRFTREFDCPVIETVGLKVSERDVEAACDEVDRKFLKALRAARANIRAFHKAQKGTSWALKHKGLLLEQRVGPVPRAGIYVPGGKAAYPSTVLMNAIPAAIAGVPEIVMVTPARPDGTISAGVLVAARECGISAIYRVGGAQAIAALAFGTATIPRVDKITGPGNAYVAAAKRMLYGRVGIDMIAGPTEVVVVADETARPEYVAADLIAQAEHDETAAAICITTSAPAAQAVELAVAMQLETAPRRSIARAALERHGAIVLVRSLGEALRLVNLIAPEHLEVMVKRPRKFADGVLAAGSIFIGTWSTEALGDYVAGPNHTLPTMSTARFSSALGVQDFQRYTQVIDVTRKRFLKLAPHAEILAEAEGLDGHAASVRIRRTPS